MSQQCADYMPMAMAARSLVISEPTLRRRVRAGELMVYREPCDRRRKWLRAAELEQFRAFVPLRGNQVEENADET